MLSLTLEIIYCFRAAFRGQGQKSNTVILHDLHKKFLPIDTVFAEYIKPSWLKPSHTTVCSQ